MNPSLYNSSTTDRLANIASSRSRRALLHVSIWTLVLLLAASRSASAQLLNFRHYTGIEGLPQSQVMAIKQDRLGYIWFATYGGLARFNGKDFRAYTTQDGLSSNSVIDIAEGDDGRLFIATGRGLCIFNQVRFQCLRQHDGLANEDVQTVSADGAGGAWASTDGGVSHLNGGTIRNYSAADGLAGGRVKRVVVDSGKRVWVANEKGVVRFDAVAQHFVVDSLLGSGDATVQFIAPAPSGLLIGFKDRLLLRHGDELTEIAPGGIPDSTVMVDGAMARDGTIWVATTTGVLRIRDGQVDKLGPANGLLPQMISRVSIDRDGDVWFGTDAGVSEHVPGPFRTYTVTEGMPSAFVRSIASDTRGRMWIGTRNGIAVREGDRFKPVAIAEMLDPRVFSIASEPSGGMLVGTRHGLFWYKDGRVKVYHDADGLRGDVAFSLVGDGGAGVWVGTRQGLVHWEAGRITQTNFPALATAHIISMVRDSRGRLWMGRSAGGIAILDHGSLRSLTPAQGATDETVWMLREDSRGRMWAATNGDGALRIDSLGIRHYTMKEGLASNFLWQVLADSRGNVWLFGNLGLDRFSGNMLTHYGSATGLVNLEGSANTAFEDAEGSLWFGTGAGLVQFRPGLEVVDAVAPPAYAEEATHDGESFPVQSDGAAPRFDRGVIRIHFGAPSFRDASAILFRYRLIGASETWSVPTSERSITYADLGPGSYRFEVVAIDRGLQSKTPAIVAFTITPAFWQTWWFRVLCIVLVVGGAAAVPLLRADALEKERRRLEQLVAKHTRDLADKAGRLERSNRDLEQFAYVASHDLQEPLRKIQAFSDRIIKGYTAQLDEQGRDYLSRIGSAAARMQQLINDLLSLSRITTKQHPMESVELHSLAHEVLGDLELRIQTTGGRVELGHLPRITGDPVQLRQVFQNLIGNALKFHRPDTAPVVKVSVEQRDDHTIDICFDDNGIGFDNKDAERVFLPFQRLHGRQEFEGTGIGLTICQKIAERHGGVIRVQSKAGEGSRFVMTLPIHGPIGEKNAA
jgi:signal transduction histidine kinase/ligand-binding sensor domain-containing protein